MYCYKLISSVDNKVSATLHAEYYHRALFMGDSTLSPNSALDLFIGFNTGHPGSVIQLTPDNSNPR